jgi:hypothetical protein
MGLTERERARGASAMNGSNILLDTNIVLYILNGEKQRRRILYGINKIGQELADIPDYLTPNTEP